MVDWYEDAYCELAVRETPIAIDEAHRLGIEFTVKMAQVRESLLSRSRKLSVDNYTRAMVKTKLLPD